jgi:hypothetical protein
MLEFLQSLPAGVLLGLAGIVGLVIVVTPAVLFGEWRKARTAKIDANLKRDLLARGLSLEEVERLTTPTRLREARINADTKVRQAQITADSEVKQAQVAADLKRDLLARGLSVEEVKRLESEEEVGEPPEREEARALANAISWMVHEGDLNTEAVQELLEIFLKKARVTEDRSERPNPASQTTAGAQEEMGGDSESSVHFSERQAVSG